jgi:hypothetical protein
MKLSALLLCSCALVVLAGCGSPAPTEIKPADAPKPKAATPSPAPAPAAPKGLGLGQRQLIVGTGSLVTLEELAMKSSEGSMYKADVSDEPGKKASVIVYGTPDTITHFYFTAGEPFADFPEEAKYPEFMKRNLKLQDTLLGNLFAGKIPADVSDALKWARENPGKEKVVSVDNKTVKVKYDVDKSISIDVK